MLADMDMELATAGGQLFNASDTNAEYGLRPYDLQAAGRDVAIGEPLDVYMKVIGATVNNVDSLDIAVVSDTDGAGGSETVLVTKNFLVAALTVANGIRRVGRIDPGLIGAAHRYLTAKVTTDGTPATAGLIQIWLSKGIPADANQGNVI